MLNSLNNTEKSNIKISDRLPKGLTKFFYTDLYLFLVLSIAAISYIFELTIMGFALFAMLATIVLVLVDDLLPAFPLMFLGVLLIPKTDNVNELLSLAYAFIPVGLAIVFHVIYYRKKIKMGKMFFAQTAISIAMLLGGIGVISSKRYLGALGYTLLLGPGILFFYFLFTNYLHKNKFVKMGDYIAKTLIFLGVFSTIQVILFYTRMEVAPNDWGSINVEVGWGISNNIATLLCFTAPMSFYFIAKGEKVYLNSLMGVFQYLGLIMTFSRGGMLFGYIVLIPVIIVCFVKSEKKLKTFAAAMLGLASIGILYAIASEEINAIIESLMRRGVGLSGRDKLYAEAWHMFLKHPIQGVGMGFNGEHFKAREIPFYWFHSTLFQVLGSTGLIGVGAFLYFYIARYKILLFRIKKDLFKQFLFLSFLGFELYSMMDTATFVPMPFMLLAMVLTSVAEKENEDLSLLYPKVEKTYEPIIIKSSKRELTPEEEEKARIFA